jgi:hypothetical protein
VKENGNRNREEQGYNIEERLKDMEEQNRNKKEIELTDEEKTRREEYMSPIEKFDDLAQYIDLKIVRGVMAYGYETPSPIQEKGIKPFLGGYDLIAQAQSGTGKTATFCIGVLGNIDYSKNEIKLLNKKYEKIKKDWDKCYATNGLSRYIGLDSACNKAHKNTIQFRKDIAELPNKIIKKCNSLHIIDKTEKSIDFSEIKKEIDDNREILKKSIVDFDSIKLDTDANMDINNIENDIMIYKKKLDKFKDESY